MTKYFCDGCGKEIDIDKDLVSVNFNSYEEARSELFRKTDGIKPEFQLCVSCAYSVYRYIKGKPKAKDGEQE